MRKLLIETPNTNVEISSWAVYMNNKELSNLIRDNIKEGNFHAKVTILIEEVEPFTIESNKPEPEPKQESEQEQE